jgi:adenosylcobinamide kinase / adenosylcobinamide-phosphate guanylyltransferase
MTVTLLIGGARSGKSSLAVTSALNWQREADDLGEGRASGSRVDSQTEEHSRQEPEVRSDFEGRQRNVVFVATGSPGDAEMADRISHHQGERPSSWPTVEAPIDLLGGIRAASEFRFGTAETSGRVLQPALIVDCLSMWVANHLMGPLQTLSEDEVAASEEAGPFDNPVQVDWAAAEGELLRQVEECFVYLKNRSAPTWFVANEVGLSLVPMSPMGRRYRDVLGRVNAKVSLLCDEAFFVVAGRVLRLERP